MSRYKGFTWNPLVPEDPLPPRLWVGLPLSALVATMLSVALITGIHALGGGGLLAAVDDARWGLSLLFLTIGAISTMAFKLPPGPEDERHRPPSTSFRMITFFAWNLIVSIATVFALHRFSETLGLDAVALSQGVNNLVMVMSLFWTVAFFTTIFVLDARHHKAPPA